MHKEVSADSGRRPPSGRPEVPCVSSQVLLGGGRELRIRHEGCEYRLRHTASGKLILTK
jgi:hemin uptake protein HemP